MEFILVSRRALKIAALITMSRKCKEIRQRDLMRLRYRYQTESTSRDGKRFIARFSVILPSFLPVSLLSTAPFFSVRFDSVSVSLNKRASQFRACIRGSTFFKIIFQKCKELFFFFFFFFFFFL